MTYTPYRKSAKYALVNWNQLSEAEAEAKIKTESYDELQGQTWAENSMKAAAVSLAKHLSLSPEESAKLVDLVLGKDKVELSPEEVAFFQSLAPKFEALPDQGAAVVSILCDIHDDWVEKTASKFVKPGKEHQKYQHLPLEMIGLAEAGSDHVFFCSILDTMGVDVPQAEIERAYTERATQFYLEHGFINEEGIDKDAIIAQVMKGKDFYEHLTPGVNEATDKETAKLVTEQSMAKMANVKMKA